MYCLTDCAKEKLSGVANVIAVAITVILLIAVLCIGGYLTIVIVGLIGQGIYYLINGNLIGLPSTNITDFGFTLSMLICFGGFFAYHIYKIIKYMIFRTYSYVEDIIKGQKEVCKLLKKC